MENKPQIIVSSLGKRFKLTNLGDVRSDGCIDITAARNEQKARLRAVMAAEARHGKSI